MSELRKLNSNILDLDEISLTKLLLDGDRKYEKSKQKDIISFYKFRPLYKAIWTPTDVTFFLNICQLAISPSFCLCIFCALHFYILCLKSYRMCSIKKFIRTHILKNICKRLLPKKEKQKRTRKIWKVAIWCLYLLTSWRYLKLISYPATFSKQKQSPGSILQWRCSVKFGGDFL